MINFGSIILIVILLAIFHKKRLHDIYSSLFILTILIEINIERGFFVNIGSQSIGYRTICEALMGVLGIYILVRRKKILKKFLKIFFVSLLCCILGWIILLIYPSGAYGATMAVSWDLILTSPIGRQPIVFIPEMIIEVIQIVLYHISALAIISLFSRNDWKRILYMFVKYSKWFVICNCSEFVTKDIFNSNIYNELSMFILGTSIDTYYRLSYRGSIPLLCGLTKEPQHYAFSLAVTIILMLVYRVAYKERMTKREIRFNTLMVSLEVLFLLLCMSFSSVYYFLCLIMIYVFYNAESKGNSSLKIITLIVVLMIGLYGILSNLSSLAEFVGISSFYGRRLNSVLEELQLLRNGGWLTASTALDWSNRVRLGSIFETIKLIKYRPILGLGLASVTAHSSLVMLMSGAGIIGTLVYTYYIFGWVKLYNSINNRLYMTLIVMFLIINLFNSLGLRPFYEFWNLLIAYSFGILAVDLKCHEG